MFHKSSLVLAPAVLLAALAAESAPATCALTIVVENIRNSRGVIGALIFNSARGWPEGSSTAFRLGNVPARQGSVTLTFSGLPPGEYAVVVLHDENENMKLDRNLFGIPKEQWGMSNNPPVHFSAPPFKQALFALRHNEQITVQLR
jgi:uncharacterized protein (DUF2141 family)